MSRTISVQSEINIHQAIKAIREFAKGSFGDNNGWLTENEAIDLVAAAETIQQNVQRKKVLPRFTGVCDSCKKPVQVQATSQGRYWEHVRREDYLVCPGGFARVNGNGQVLEVKK